MAKKIKKGKIAEQAEKICMGGKSFASAHTPHRQGKHLITCFRCGAPMGCTAILEKQTCVQRPRELICLVCHNWAHPKGVEYHGNIVANPKVPNVRVDDGKSKVVWKHWHEGDPNPLLLVDRILKGEGLDLAAMEQVEGLRKRILVEAERERLRDYRTIRAEGPKGDQPEVKKTAEEMAELDRRRQILREQARKLRQNNEF